MRSETKVTRYSSILRAEKLRHTQQAALAIDPDIRAAHRESAAALDFALGVIEWTCGETRPPRKRAVVRRVAE